MYGRVTKLVPFGAFVQVGEGIEGLVHISEMAAHHVEAPEQVVTPGEELWVKIIDIDLERRRISLSIKQAAEGGEVAAEYREFYGEHAYDEQGNYIGPDYARRGRRRRWRRWRRRRSASGGGVSAPAAIPTPALRRPTPHRLPTCRHPRRRPTSRRCTTCRTRASPRGPSNRHDGRLHRLSVRPADRFVVAARVLERPCVATTFSAVHVALAASGVRASATRACSERAMRPVVSEL